jgi:hypothetical protein
MRQRGFSGILILIGLVVVLAVIGGAYYLGTQNNQVSKLQSSQNQQLPSSTTVIPSATTQSS